MDIAELRSTLIASCRKAQEMGWTITDRITIHESDKGNECCVLGAYLIANNIRPNIDASFCGARDALGLRPGTCGAVADGFDGSSRLARGAAGSDAFILGKELRDMFITNKVTR